MKLRQPQAAIWRQSRDDDGTGSAIGGERRGPRGDPPAETNAKTAAAACQVPAPCRCWTFENGVGSCSRACLCSSSPPSGPFARPLALQMEVVIRKVARVNKEVTGMLSTLSGSEIKGFVACGDDAFANVPNTENFEVSEPGAHRRVGILKSSLRLGLAKLRAY